ncbi:thioredoxin fold domain-containing protein [Flammeovirgaceae bacterium SG7u.111]|nr:thioredoxin fold domain-containing protein [Flammeovirgaceae bacterium SG7u.132]WPO38091.1 thioredoxin fold domain-containing protein [Flammeovirgaceae bacterium SG7u.111]
MISKRISTVFALSFLLAVGMSFTTSPISTEPTEKPKEVIQWLSMEEALVKMEKEPRKLMVDVYTDWCGYCKLMDKNTFSDAEVASYVNKNYYAVKLNAESEKSFFFRGESITESQMAGALGVRGYPTIVFIEKDLETTNPSPGYKKAKPFLKELERNLEE